jgi:hypothetical protein
MARSTGTLAKLFDPVSPQAFVDEYWGRKTLFVPGDAAKIETLFGRPLGWDDYHEVARRLSQWSHKRLTLYAAALICGPGPLEHRDRTGGFLPIVGVDPVQAPRLLAAGIPVTLPKAHWYCGPIAQLVRGVASDIVGLRELDCLLTTNVKGAGVASHFDAFPSFHIQLAGRKRWQVAPSPEQAWPKLPGVIDSEGRKEYIDSTGRRVGEPLDRSQLVEYQVKPGDVLYLPAGTWHEAHVEGEPVLALELLFNRFPIGEVALQVLARRLERTPLRRDAPIFLADREPVWSMPKAAEEELQAVIDELRSQLEQLEATDFELHRAWKRGANGFSMEPDAVLPVIRPTGTERPDTVWLDGVALTPDSLLRVSDRGPLTAARGASDGEALVLSQQNMECPIEPELVAFGLRLVASAGEPFRAGDTTGWSEAGELSWDALHPTLARLLAMRVLETCDARA